MELGKTLLRLEFQLNLEDFLETVRMREPRSAKLIRRILMAVGSMLVAALLGVPLVVKDVPGFLAAFLLGVLPLAVLLVIVPWYYKPDRFYKSYFRTHAFKPCQVEIGEEGRKLCTNTSESVLLWKAFSEYSESKTQLVLTSGMVQYIFPKRVMEQSKFAELVAFVRTKIPIRVSDFGSH
ncbi:MAG TPA: YcxB family protein [Candidatus Acidoferrum sp.]|nr:YcxB family protein [Candidatus Acidoferrum sp.]